MIEALCACGVFMMCLYLISLSLNQYVGLKNNIYEDRDIEWYAFLATLEREVKEASAVQVNDKHIKLESNQHQGKSFIYEQYQNMIRRKSTKGGHQPVLLEVAMLQLTSVNRRIKLEVQFENGLTRQAYLSYPNGGAN